MADIRKLAEKDGNLKKEFCVLYVCTNWTYLQYFSHLERLSHPLIEAATDDEIEALFAKIIPVDSTVQQSDTQKKDFNFRSTWITAVFNDITFSPFASVVQKAAGACHQSCHQRCFSNFTLFQIPWSQLTVVSPFFLLVQTHNGKIPPSLKAKPSVEGKAFSFIGWNCVWCTSLWWVLKTQMC